jgi:hypothetical protein
MASESDPRSSRRALLAAAAGAAGVLAATAALPAVVVAADPDDVVKESDNPTTATTSITDSGDSSTAFAGHATGPGSAFGVEGTSVAGAGVFGWSVAAPDWDPPFEPMLTSNTGVFGSAPSGDGVTTYGTGVWGDSPDTGVYGTGGYGVQGYGGIGVAGYTNGLSGGIGVYAAAPNTSSLALQVDGKVKFSRSGRLNMSTGASKVTVTLAGVTAYSKVFAVLASSESGRYVRAVVPATNSFTAYLNTSLTSSAKLAWFVLD